MKRRTLLLIAMLTVLVIGWTVAPSFAGPNRKFKSVSFGQWESEKDPPLDRVVDPSPSRGAGVISEIQPNFIRINRGGTIEFVVTGLHNVQVFGPGTQPEDINTDLIDPDGSAGGIINDTDGRIYRGLSPYDETVNRERTEVVRFTKPGTYLVMCGIHAHFVDDLMFAFVKVRERSIDD